ncbi:hypothetical protein C4A73_03681 [Escherichia coli]|nr:hypothetical protein C4A73_03681 [Escherichia coli]RDO80821.1 hypothetical protein C4A66_02945 [Escherichia coli]RDP02443.1 hypothetical protein C4A64_02803 [Escherichia coli]
MSSFVAHPHAGIFRLTGHDIGVLHRPQTVMKTGHKHGVRCSHICRVGARFRTQVIIITTRRRFRFRARVRRRCWFRVRRVLAAGQIPVTTVASLTTSQPVIISTCSYTTGLNEFSTVGVTVDMNQFNTIECLCSCTAGISNSHTGLTGCITFNHQFIRYRAVISQNGVHEQRAVITGVVAANSQHITRSISSQVKSAAVGHIPCDTTIAGKCSVLSNIDLAAGKHDRGTCITQNQCTCSVNSSCTQTVIIMHLHRSLFSDHSGGGQGTAGTSNTELTTAEIQGAGAGECAGRYATTGQSQITAIDIQYRACSTVQFTGSLAVAVHVQLGISSQANFTGLSQSTVAVHEDIATANICYSCVSIFRRQNQRTFTSFSQRFSIPARR